MAIEFGPFPEMPRPPKYKLHLPGLKLMTEIKEFCEEVDLEVPDRDDVEWNETGRWQIAGKVDDPVLEIEIVIAWPKAIIVPHNNPIMAFFGKTQVEPVVSQEVLIVAFVQEGALEITMESDIQGEFLPEILEEFPGLEETANADA